jgi:hypothetical protein
MANGAPRLVATSFHASCGVVSNGCCDVPPLIAGADDVIE